MLSYHELTAGQPRGAGGQKQQLIVVCVLMFAAFLHSFAMAGGFQTVQTAAATFDGGDFCYKLTSRDYAASMSLLESVGRDLGLKSQQQTSDGYADALYTLYLDPPSSMSADRLRFAVGHLARTPDSKKVHQSVLLEKNREIIPLSETDTKDLAVQAIWPRLPYQTTYLPRAEQALIGQFPFTDGFVSTLLFSYKIMPSILKQAKEAGMKEPLAVMSTCSVQQRMCTHYALSGKVFSLGQPDTGTYAKSVGPDSLLPWAEMRNTLLKPLVWTGLASPTDGNADEL